MADYKTIHGTLVRTYTTNPDNPIEGQVWYNDTDNVLKFNTPNTFNTWSTGSNANTIRENVAGAGIQTSAIAAGGYAPSANAPVANVESYNGSTWTETTDFNSARASAGSACSAPSTGAIIFGGITPPTAFVGLTETWDGTSWTEVGDLNDPRIILGGAGTSNTAALAYAGNSPGHSAVCELWNGSSWTEVADFSTGRKGPGDAGTSTAALA